MKKLESIRFFQIIDEIVFKVELRNLKMTNHN